MIRLRLSGTLRDLKRSQKKLKKDKAIRIVSMSEPVENRRSKKYKHYYAEIEFV